MATVWKMAAFCKTNNGKKAKVPMPSELKTRRVLGYLSGKEYKLGGYQIPLTYTW